MAASKISIPQFGFSVVFFVFEREAPDYPQHFLAPLRLGARIVFVFCGIKPQHHCKKTLSRAKTPRRQEKQLQKPLWDPLTRVKRTYLGIFRPLARSAIPSPQFLAPLRLCARPAFCLLRGAPQPRKFFAPWRLCTKMVFSYPLIFLTSQPLAVAVPGARNTDYNLFNQSSLWISAFDKILDSRSTPISLR